ncbi:LuxR C-terminal-related transcriptional regulator [Salisediminibacterium beveridgei]|uniref:Two component transcriptional regulator, LuxR family n=1 Tax=Salisediminibacterium beveridgei TaxID=632773 RepID=A0A1D7QTM9_9BACI|nr:response regulator transcription factor [Salisediminibacterium beveridgei]AOM82383.1 two component transcriptional regulator, LuxR family [Salisediminibacterium beveridgei]
MNIAVIDPQEVTSEGLRQLLKASYFIDDFLTYRGPAQFLADRRDLQLDLLITELCLPTPLDGLTFLDQLHDSQLVPNRIRHTAVLTYCDDLLFERQVRQRDASGFLCKQMTKEEIVERLDLVLAGKQSYPHPSESSITDRGTQVLSRKEKEVFTMLVRGYAYKDISSVYRMSVHTVETHRQNISRKLGKSARHEWFDIAKQMELI